MGKSFDSFFEEEKVAPGQAPVKLAGPKSFDSYFADEANIPEEGLNTIENKRGGAVRTAVQMTAPMLATGGAGILSRPMGIVGKYGLDALAGAGSEKVLQALGISEESPTMVALSALAGPTGRLFGSAVTGVPKITPGYRDAARAGLTEHVRALPGQIIPHGDPKAAYNAIQGNMNTIMPNWPELSATVAKHVTQSQQVNWPALKKMTNSTPLENLVANIEQSLQGTPAQVVKEPVTGKGVAFGKPTGLKAQAVTVPAQPPGLTFENARANIEALSSLIRSQKGSAEAGVLKDIKRAMLTDLEHMPTPPGTPLAQWNEARAAYRDQKTSMLLSDVIEQHTTSREGIEMVNPDGILKTLRTNKELRERLSTPQLEQLESTLKDWANASGGTRSKLAAMLTGMTIGGGPAGALAGWGAAEITTKMLMNESARKMIGNIIANPSVHNISRGTAIISAAIRGAFDRPGETPMPFETEITPGKVMGTLPTEARTEPKAIERSPAPPVPSGISSSAGLLLHVAGAICWRRARILRAAASEFTASVYVKREGATRSAASAHFRDIGQIRALRRRSGRPRRGAEIHQFLVEVEDVPASTRRSPRACSTEVHAATQGIRAADLEGTEDGRARRTGDCRTRSQQHRAVRPALREVARGA